MGRNRSGRGTGWRERESTVDAEAAGERIQGDVKDVKDDRRKASDGRAAKAPSPLGLCRRSPKGKTGPVRREVRRCGGRGSFRLVESPALPRMKMLVDEQVLRSLRSLRFNSRSPGASALTRAPKPKSVTHVLTHAITDPLITDPLIIYYCLQPSPSPLTASRPFLTARITGSITA
jgi:hypothetical protein